MMLLLYQLYSYTITVHAHMIAALSKPQAVLSDESPTEKHSDQTSGQSAASRPTNGIQGRKQTLMEVEVFLVNS